jgi:hypothetical protein
LATIYRGGYKEREALLQIVFVVVFPPLPEPYHPKLSAATGSASIWIEEMTVGAGSRQAGRGNF